MTKLDFAIHLFTAARSIGSGSVHRVPVVSMLMLLVLSRRPDEWISGTGLADLVANMSSSTMVSSTRSAVEAGLLDRRPIAGGFNGALEWKITPAGQRMVVQLLEAKEPEPASA